MSKAGRSQWFSNRASVAGMEPDSDSLQVERTVSGNPYHWKSLGPTNIGGRSTCLALDPRNPKALLLGSAAGGVWVSRNAGRSWRSVWDDQPSLNIGSLAMHPDDPDDIYVGTGEANGSLDSYPGIGVFRGHRAANSRGEWRQIGNTKTDRLPKRIGSIAVDRHADLGHVLIGSASTEPGEISGIHEGWEQTDGSFKWTAISGYAFGDSKHPPEPDRPSAPFRCHSILFHPDEEGVAFAAVNMRGWRSGIWRLRDGVWKHLTSGLPPGEYFGRTSLAISASDPKVIWAYAAHRRSSVMGVFFSKDMGDSWSATGGFHFAAERAAYYNSCIAVHPKHPGSVICGGVDLHRTRDFGANWEQVTEWDLPPSDPRYAHADHHALAITEDGIIFDANDGGLNYSPDFGDSWSYRGGGLVTTMFYGVDVSATNHKLVIGGAQDNGSLLHEPGDDPGEFYVALGGDGGVAIIDPYDPEHIYGSSQHVNIAVTTGSGWRNASPEGLTEGEREVWMSFLAMDTSKGRAKPRPVFLGTTRIWKTRTDGDQWLPVSPFLDGTPVSALEVAPANSRFVYAGTEQGGFFRSTDGGNTWSDNLAGIDLPYSQITRIESHPKNHLHVLVTIAATPPPGEVGGSYAHIFLSRDGGRHWGSADPGVKLPRVPHNSLAFETVEPYRVFVATDIGVYAGEWNESGGAYVWDDLIGDMPNVIVTAVVYNKKARSLTAGTYGRGIFRLQMEKPGKKMRKGGRKA